MLVRDITERKQAETELRVHRDHLEELVEARTAELREVNAGLEREIADRARAEKELEEQRNRLQTITTVTPDLLVLLDRDLVYRAVNPAFCHFIGKREEELIGRTDFDVFPQAAAEVYRRSDEEVVASGELHILEREAADADGTTWWLQVAKAPIFDAAGEVSGLLVSARDITERRMAEEALRESEELYRELVETSPDSISFVDLEGTVLAFNRQGAAMVGFDDPRDVVGRSLLEFIARDEDREAAAADVQRVVTEATAMNVSYDLRRADGSIFPTESSASLVRGADGEPKGLILVTRDVTERRRAEEALRESEERHRVLFEGGNDAVFVFNLTADGEPSPFIEVNEEACRRLGYSAAELHRLTPADVAPPEKRAAAADKIRQLSKDKELIFEWVHLRKDGTEIPVEISSHLFEFRGEPTVISIVRDITERKRAEQALRESEAKYRDLFENANDLIQSVTPEGRFLYVNRAWNEALGFDDDELSELNLFDIVHPASRAGCRESFDRVLAGERLDNVEAVFVTKDGREVVVEGSASCRFDEGRPVSTRGIFRDVTERKRTEEALRESEERYRLLANNVSDVILTMDLGLRFTYISPSVTPLLGYSVEEMTALTLKKISTPASFKVTAKTLAEEIAREMAATQDLKRSRTVGVELIRKDGSSVHVEAKAIFLRDPNDKAIGILAVARDVTERKQAEEALRASEERLRALFELSPEAVIVLDPQGTVLDVNVNAYAWFGLRRQDIIGKKFDVFPFVPDDVKEKTLAAFARRLAGEDIPPYELDVNTPDGGKWRLSVRGEILRNDKGEVVADLVMVSRVPLPKEAAG